MAMRRRLIILAIALALAFPVAVLADTVILNNGTQLQGDVKRTDTGWTVTTADGKTLDLAANDVKSIEVGSARPTEATAQANLASLRRSVAALASPQLALERYQRFLTQSKGTAAYDQAKTDMAVWQDRLNRGLLKVGLVWVTPEEKNQMAQQATGLARQAAELMDQGRDAEAAPLLQKALDADPLNPTALYLRGLELFDQKQTVAARKSFENVLSVFASHAPSLNNLAVILWKQNQQMGAMRYYDLSLAEQPPQRPILDNIAEALNALPEDQRRNPLAVRVAQRFAQQDAQMQFIMAQRGLHRWGATWVDQATLDKLKLAEQAVKEKLAKIEDEAKADQARIGDINTAIDNNNRSMNQMVANSFVRDSAGNFFQAPLPALYYTMQNDNQQLAAEKAGLEQKLQRLDDEAKRAYQDLPVPPYTSVQRMIGPEGAPLPPTTQPSTQLAQSPTSMPSSLPTTAPGASPLGLPVSIPLP
jgi:Flp pilus assembly protein TadD